MSTAVVEERHGPTRDPDVMMTSFDAQAENFKTRDGPHLSGAVSQEFSTIISSSSLVTASVLNATSSNPVSPGSPRPRDQPKTYSFTPPSRPSSTPFLLHDHRSPTACLLNSSITDSRSDLDLSQSQGVPPRLDDAKTAASLLGLPQEIQEVIIDHIFGYRISVVARSRTEMHVKKWSKSPRYARRKELANLSLVGPLWRDLVQGRLFQHIRLKGDESTFHNAATFFQTHTHLQNYVRHLEVWFPVFSSVYIPSMPDTAGRLLPVQPAPYQYRAPTCAATLHDVFSLVAYLLPNVAVLTIEGGDRKKAPQVQHVRSGMIDDLPMLASVETLVTRGQWNLLRTNRDFDRVLSALPNLREWQGAYDKPKSKSYLGMAGLLRSMPGKLASLNLVMEPDYRREYTVPLFFVKVGREIHFCQYLAAATRRLEHLSFTGRVCPTFFNDLVACGDPRYSKLRSIDVTLKNNCYPFTMMSETGSGIHEPRFIEGFEKTVIAAIRALPKLPMLEHLRIRFVDLGECLSPLLLPPLPSAHAKVSQNVSCPP